MSSDVTVKNVKRYPQCDGRCQYAIEGKCHCQCHGRYHGFVYHRKRKNQPTIVKTEDKRC